MPRRAAALIALAACAPPQVDGGPRAQISGCMSLLDGPVCVHRPGRALHLWVDAADPEGLELRVDGARDGRAAVPWADGVSFDLQGVGAGLVELWGPDGGRLAAVELRPDAEPWMDAMKTGTACAGDPGAEDATRRAFWLSGRARCPEEPEPLARAEQAIAAHAARGDGLRVAWDESLWAHRARERGQPRDRVWAMHPGATEARFLWFHEMGRDATARGHLADGVHWLGLAGEEVRRARRDDEGQWAADAAAAWADALASAGRVAEARAAVRDGLGEVTDPCARALLWENLAWNLLLAPAEPELALQVLDEAERDRGGASACRDPGEQPWFHVAHRAEALRQLGQLDAAAAAWAGAPPDPSTRAPEVRGWGAVLRAALDADRGDTGGAAARLEALLREADPTADGAPLWRARLLLAELRARVGDAAGAEALREELVRRTPALIARAPLKAGRAELLTALSGAAEALARTRLARGDAAGALAVLRAQRSALLRAVVGPGRAAAEGAIGDLTYADLRRFADDTADSGLDAGDRGETGLPLPSWQLSPAERAARARARAAEAEGLRRAVEAAGGDPDAAALPPPVNGELLLLIWGAPGAWEALAWPAGGDVRALPPAPDPEALLRALDPLLGAARRVRLLPWGPAREERWAALPWRGAPLGLQRPLSTGLDLGPPPAFGPAAVPVLVITDPEGDLAGARAEGAAVTRAFPGAERLDGDAAALGPVIERLSEGVDLLHFAGHATYRPGGWGAELRLAGGEALEAWRLVTLPRPPRRVVMTACESARAAPGVGEGLGLAQALLAAGAESVVAADVPLPDGLAQAFTAAFSATLSASGDLDAAVQAGLAAAHAEDPAGPWWALRLWER